MMNLKVIKRNNRNGKMCVAPFINDYNVWDIPVKQWTPEVQSAILSAYALGVQQLQKVVKQQMQDITKEQCSWSIQWPEPVNEISR